MFATCHRAGQTRVRSVRLRARLFVRPLEERIEPTTFVVTNMLDGPVSQAGQLPGSLRQAIFDANSNPGADSVSFDPVVFASSHTIFLTSGELPLTDALNIVGISGNVIIDAGNASRIFNIDVPGKSNQPFLIANLTLTNGATPGAGGGIFVLDEVLTLTDSTVSGCSTSANGGAICVGSSTSFTKVNYLSVDNCTLTANSASSGGAIAMTPDSPVNVTGCTISGNVAGKSGGGVYMFDFGTLNLTDSTLSGNRANLTSKSASTGGGGVYLYSSKAFITNSTLYGNSAERGGALFSSDESKPVINNCTMFGNTANAAGGGLFVTYFGSFTPTITLNSTILSGNINSTTPDLSSATALTISANHCLIGVANNYNVTLSGSNNLTGTLASPLDAKLAPLAWNGGGIMTQALLAGSPAIDHGSNPSLLTHDQRGSAFGRSFGAAPDIGAFESSPLPFASAIWQDSVLNSNVQKVQIAFTDNNGIAVNSLGTGNIKITGSNGFVALPTLASVDVNSNGTPRVATYQFTPPGGSWDLPDSASYSVSVVPNQVFDIDSPAPNAVPASPLMTVQVAMPRVFVVDHAVDENDGNFSPGNLSFREAIALANASVNDTAPDLITFDPVVFGAPQTMSLTLGQFIISDGVTIKGPATGLTIDAGNASRFFFIDVPGKSRQPIAISYLNMINGTASAGAAIANQDESLSLSHISLIAGQIYSNIHGGSLDISDSTLSGNINPGSSSGGAIKVGSAQTFSMTRTSVVGNSADYEGGGLYVSATISATISDCLIANNKTGYPGKGGGIYVSAPNILIRNSTISGNSSYWGGGAYFAYGSNAILQNLTVALNSATSLGGGIMRSSSATVTMNNSVVGKNTAPEGPDVNASGGVTGNNNIISNTFGGGVAGSNNKLNVDPLLGPLANYGGPTLTHALLPGSPAINAGAIIAGITTDQRGYLRTYGSAPDIGAYELQPPRVASVVVNDGSVQRSRVTSVTVNFDSLVALQGLPADAFGLQRQSDGQLVNLTTFVVNATTTSVIFTFAGALSEFGSLQDGRYTLTAFGNQVFNFVGGLDGNGDGVPGDNYVLASSGTAGIFRLFGDADGDASVSANDFVFFRQSFNSVNDAFDFDGDGLVSVNDFIQFRNRFNTSI
jgi:hypothetical protein